MTRNGWVIVAAVYLASCDGDVTEHAIGGTVSGLLGTGLVLVNNGGDPLPIVEDGSFTFSTMLAVGASYSVGIGAQPTAVPRQTCVVAKGAGVVHRPVRNVTVSCRTVAGEPVRGTFLYSVYMAPPPNASLTSYVAGFSIDPWTGALTELPGSPFAFRIEHTPLELHNFGRFLFVKGQGLEAQQSLTGFAIDSATGALTLIPGMPMNRMSAYGTPFSDAGGRALYLPRGDLFVYTLNSTSGALTAAPGSPFDLGDYGSRTGIFNAAGTTLFVPFSTGALIQQGGVSAFAVDANSGALSFQGGTELLSDVGALAMHPGERYAVLRGSRHVRVLRIDSPASIPLAAELRVAATAGPVFDASGQYAYFINWAGLDVNGNPMGPVLLSGYRLDAATGALEPVAGLPPSIAGRLSIDPAGRFIVVHHSSVGVAVFKIDAMTGEVTHAPSSPFTPAVGSNPMDVLFEPSGRFAYMPDEPSFSISAYSFDSTNGRFTFVGSYPRPTRPIDTVVVVPQ